MSCTGSSHEEHIFHTTRTEGARELGAAAERAEQDEEAEGTREGAGAEFETAATGATAGEGGGEKCEEVQGEVVSAEEGENETGELAVRGEAGASEVNVFLRSTRCACSVEGGNEKQDDDERSDSMKENRSLEKETRKLSFIRVTKNTGP